jgi:serine/threonine protein phosphatase 1
VSTFAVGDIHGNLPALEDLLAQLRPEITTGDTVVFLGDYIDRGADSKACVDALLQFNAASPAQTVFLFGNHEEWMLRTARDYRDHAWLLAMDALPTIESYSTAAAAAIRAAKSAAGLAVYEGHCELPYELFFGAMPDEHVSFFRELLPYHVTDDCICSHGGLNPAIKKIEDQHWKDLVWGTSRFPDGYAGAEAIVYGHWNNAELDDAGRPRPRIVGRTFGLDTISHGVLTAVRLPDRMFYQSRSS